MIDLGWAMARIELTDIKLEDDSLVKRPQLVICWPGDEHQSSGSISLWDLDGLHNLRDGLAFCLDEFDTENPVPGQTGVDTDEGFG